MQQFNLDISAPRGPLVLYVSQGDSLSRFFSVTVTDNGTAYTPPDGAIYTVRFGATGMPAGWYDTITEVGGGTHPAVMVDKNTYTVEIAEQALGTPGKNTLVLIVSDATGYTLASWAFVLQVAAVPGYDAPEATVYYNALSAQVAQTLANAQAAAASATLAESWAVGGTGTRSGEDTNNAQYWAQQAQSTSSGQLGWFETEQALQAAHPTGENGQWAIIGTTDTIWTWDSDTSKWKDTNESTDLSNYYTKAQSDARYATAAQGELAARAVQSVNGLPGPNPSLTAANVGAAPASDGISTYTCTTSGTVHALTGTGNNIKFVADAAFAAGGTITVNGQVVTAQTQDGAALADGAWAAGVVVVCYLEGTTLNFKGASGAKLSLALKMWLECGAQKTWAGNYWDSIDGGFEESDFVSVVSEKTRGTQVELNVQSGKYLIFAALSTNITNQALVSGSAFRLINSGGEAVYQYTEAEQVYFSACSAEVVDLPAGVYKPQMYRAYATSCYATILMMKVG